MESNLYTPLSNLIIGFHGCDKSVFEAVLNSRTMLKPSKNDYDWLGSGIYFWENNLERAWKWAEDAAANPRSSISEPAVLGAVIDMGYCLNLLDSNNIRLLGKAYESLSESYAFTGKPLPKNLNVKGNTDLLLRKLDCLVIETLHKNRNLSGEIPFDSARGVFFEGGPIYPNSGFMAQSHIQICVRNPNCIKGFFAPKQENPRYNIP